LKIANHAVESNKIFAMNLSAPFIVQFFGDQLASAIQYCDFVFGNESEAAAYGEAKGYGTDLEIVAVKLAAQPKVYYFSILFLICYCNDLVLLQTVFPGFRYKTPSCCVHARG